MQIVRSGDMALLQALDQEIGEVFVECLFLRSASQAPYGTHRRAPKGHGARAHIGAIVGNTVQCVCTALYCCFLVHVFVPRSPPWRRQTFSFLS
jgi:hypothetical protein